MTRQKNASERYPSTAHGVSAEICAMRAIFRCLQDLISTSAEQGSEDRKLMLLADDIIITLAGCLLAFSELEEMLTEP
jgi:hypothetical protein